MQFDRSAAPGRAIEIPSSGNHWAVDALNSGDGLVVLDPSPYIPESDA